jgi:hypothetical protein
MNLYLLFAIALGAISGTSEAPVARPAFAAVVATSGVRAERQVVRAATASMLRSAAAPRAAFASWRVPARAEAPLAGAGTPRAPSA